MADKIFPWNKGLKGGVTPGSFKKGHKPWGTGLPKEKQPFFGKKHTEEWKKLMSEKLKNRKFSKETREKMRESKIKLYENGYKQTEEHRKKNSLKNSGKNSVHWKGGITPKSIAERTSQKSLIWKKEVLKRDKYLCRECGKNSNKLTVHHVLPYSVFPELRHEKENGITLCNPCHMKTETYAGRVNHKRREDFLPSLKIFKQYGIHI